MSEQTFDRFTRQAAVAISRRNSLLALGGATLATGLARSSASAAKDNDKKKAKKAKKKFKKQCNQKKDQCRTLLLGLPGGAAALFCCDSCFSDDFLSCLFSIAA
jgi:hypothetical protein